MTSFIADSNLRTLLQVDTLLVLVLMSTSNYTSVLRVSRRAYANPEDYAQKRLPLPASFDADASVARSRRIHLNHLENVLPFLLLSLLYALTQPSHALFAGLLWSFLIARVTYSGFYALGLQPHRTIAYTAGLLIQVAIAILTLVAALAS